jgi:hypothetical protein
MRAAHRGQAGRSLYRVIKKVGLDIGIAEETALAWNVFAPAARLGQGDPAGKYAGADASFGLGVGGTVLIGGSNDSIALQSLSVQGEVGLSVAAGLELRPRRSSASRGRYPLADTSMRFEEFVYGRIEMASSHGGNGQLDDGKPRLSEDDMARALLGPRGVPGKPDTAKMTPQQEKNMPKYVDPGHTE